jgi:hypothetical protein
LVAQPELRHELGRRGYEGLLSNWTREVHLERYLDLVKRTAMEKFGEARWLAASDSKARSLEEALT